MILHWRSMTMHEPRMPFAFCIAQAFGRELPGTLVFDYPSVPALASHLHSLLAPAQQLALATARQRITPATLESQLPASGPGAALMALHIAARMPPLLPAAIQSTSSTAGAAAVSGGGDAVGAISLQRWDLDGLRDGAHPLRVRFGGFVQGVEAFDAAAFGITPPEAQLMDPQQRLLMEASVHL